MGRVEQQRMRKALIDAEMELQQGAVTAQDKRRALQVPFTYPHIVLGQRSLSWPEEHAYIGIIMHCPVVNSALGCSVSATQAAEHHAGMGSRALCLLMCPYVRNS